MYNPDIDMYVQLYYKRDGITYLLNLDYSPTLFEGNPRNPLSNGCLRKAGVCFATCQAPPTTCEGLDSMLKEGGCASRCPPCVGETMTLIMGCSRIGRLFSFRIKKET